MPTTTIATPDGPMRAHLSVPDDGTGPWPGVLVVHDALGMTSDLLRQTRWLADTGFLAVAPDLYHRGGRLRCLLAAMRSLVAGEGVVFDDLAATRDWLAGRDDCTGRIGVIGFCLGGGFAMTLASVPGYEVSSVNYGQITDDDALAGACPVVGSYGGRDRSMGDTPEKLKSILTRHGIDHDVKVYPEAGHGFMNDHPPQEMPLWARIPGAYSNTAYHAAAEADARARIEAFFAHHLTDQTRA